MFQYTAESGGKVEVPKVLDAYKELGITPSTSFAETKRLFREAITRPGRQHRALASLAYHMITSSSDTYSKSGTCFEIKNPTIFLYAAIGHTGKVLEEISKNERLLNSEDEYKRTVIYLTARAGFYDTTEALIFKKAEVNRKQADDSTSLHAAAFYEQKLIVKLLLAYGADPSIKNKHGNTPADESTLEIKKIFEEFKKDPISSIANILALTNSVDGKIHHILHEGKSIAREMFRNTDLMHSSIKCQWSEIQRDWETCFHGTKCKNIESIMKHGLVPSGTTLPYNGARITPPSNHFQLGKTYFGIDNWAHAVFVSPSIRYASHECYSERVITGNSKWCVVMKVLLQPSSYQSYKGTVPLKLIDGEPDNIEYRVSNSSKLDPISRMLKRRLEAQNAIVQSVLFIDMNFIEYVDKCELKFSDLQKLFSQ